MKTLASVRSVVFVFLLAAILTLVSLAYVRPANCQRICDDPIQAPCPPGSCRIGEQRAGFPFPVLIDKGGGSPTTGWGRVGAEDYPPDIFGLFANITVYILLVAFGRETLLVLRKKRSSKALLVKCPLLIIGLAALFFGVMRDSSYPPVAARAIGNAQAELLGNWLRDADRNGFMLRFYDSGQFSIVPTDQENFQGDYAWVNDQTIQLRLSSSGYAPYQYCRQIPADFQGYCTSEALKPFNPDAYPGPDQIVNSPYPVPTNAPIEMARVEAIFMIAINGDLLTLTPRTGSALTFRRVTIYPPGTREDPP